MRPREKKRAGEGTRTLDIQLGKLDVAAKDLLIERLIADYLKTNHPSRATSTMRLSELVKKYGDSRDLSTPYLKMLFSCVKTMLPAIETVNQITPDAINA